MKCKYQHYQDIHQLESTALIMKVPDWYNTSKVWIACLGIQQTKI